MIVRTPLREGKNFHVVFTENSQSTCCYASSQTVVGALFETMSFRMAFRSVWQWQSIGSSFRNSISVAACLFHTVVIRVTLWIVSTVRSI
jgi:hypothetical protein